MAGEKILIARQDTLEAVQQDTQAILADTAAIGGDTQGVLERIGNTTDTGGSATAGTLMGKGNAVLSILTSGGTKVVKSIQRVKINFISNNVPVTANISPVNPERCIVLVEESDYNSALGYSYDYTLTETQLSFTMNGNRNYSTTYGFWIVEFY